MGDILQKLHADLDDLARNAISRAKNVPFSRVRDPRRRDFVSVLRPSEDQRQTARSEAERFAAWSRTVAAVLRRRGASADVEKLERFTKDMHALLLFQRQDVAAVTEGMWRRGFELDLARVSAFLHALLTANEPWFEIRERRQPLDYMPFVLQVLSNAPGQWIVRANDCEEAFAIDSPPQLLPNATADAVVEAGRTLFRTAFVGRIGNAYQSALMNAVQAGRGLRLELSLERAGDASSFPWELLHDGRQFLAMRSGGAVARVVAVRDLRGAPHAVVPLRILVTISTPKSLPWLGGDEERRRIEAAVAPLVTLGLMDLTVAPDGSLNTMRRMFASAEAAGRPFQGWHFIGHGDFDQRTGCGVLAMTDENRDAHWASGWELGTLFRDHPQLHFAILNACDGARTSPRGPMFGVATSLIESGIPRVVAMQSPVTNEAALIFAEELYGALADGASFDEAVVEGRRGIFFRPDVVEWMTPVVFMAVTERDGSITFQPGG